MKKSIFGRVEINEKLADIDQKMSRLKNKLQRDVEFWPTFADELDAIILDASVEDYDWAVTQINALLSKHDKPPDERRVGDRRVSVRRRWSVLD